MRAWVSKTRVKSYVYVGVRDGTGRLRSFGNILRPDAMRDAEAWCAALNALRELTTTRALAPEHVAQVLNLLRLDDDDRDALLRLLCPERAPAPEVDA